MMQMGARQGMRLLNDSLFELAQAGTISPKEALAKSVDKGGIRSLLEGAGFVLDGDAPVQELGTDSGASAPVGTEEPKSPLPSVPKPEEGASDDAFERIKQMRGR